MSLIEAGNTKKNVGLRVIGIMKLVSATLLLTLTFGIFHMVGRDMATLLEQYVRRLHLATGNKFVTNLIAKASGVSPGQLRSAGIVTFIYSLLYIVEGIGLIMAKHWAEYLTIIVTGALVPLEIYEVIGKPGIARITILFINLVIVGYLIYRLRTNKLRETSSIRKDI